MIAVALKGLAGRKVRALLTALAVVIGISMVSGTYILTDTMQKSFDGLFAATYEKTDAVISGKEIVKNSTTGSSARIPAALLAQVQDAPRGRRGRRHASRRTRPTRPTSSARTARRSPARAWAAATTPRTREFSPAEAQVGRVAQGPAAGRRRRRHRRQAALRARRHRSRSRRSAARRTYELTGIVKYGDVDSLGFASIAAWDLKTAQTLLHREGSYDSISISAAKGTSSKELVRAVQPLVPGALQVKDSDKQAKDDAARARQLDVDPEVLPARVRRDRAAGRRVRDLQHAVDHGRPADAGVRDAADARRLAQAGHALGRRRGPRHRRCSPR